MTFNDVRQPVAATQKKSGTGAATKLSQG